MKLAFLGGAGEVTGSCTLVDTGRIRCTVCPRTWVLMVRFDAETDRLAEAYAHVDEMVRRLDKDRYLAALWAPQDKRPHLLALYAFSAEIARIRDVVSDPLPGEVRARWWADVITGARGTGKSSLVKALLNEYAELKDGVLYRGLMRRNPWVAET